MISENTIIKATCDCGREIRVNRSVAKDFAKCPVCGSQVPLPVSAGVDPPCPRCKRPWPRTDKRCPHCLNRSRAPIAEDLGGSFSGRFDAIEEEEEESPQPRRRRRRKQRTGGPGWGGLGWTIAAGFLTIVGVVSLGTGLLDGLQRPRVGIGVAFLLTAWGVLKGWSIARLSMLVLGGIVVVGRLGVWLLTVPHQMTSLYAPLALAAGMLTLIALAMLTKEEESSPVLVMASILLLAGVVLWQQAGQRGGPGPAARDYAWRRTLAAVSMGEMPTPLEEDRLGTPNGRSTGQKPAGHLPEGATNPPTEPTPEDELASSRPAAVQHADSGQGSVSLKDWFDITGLDGHGGIEPNGDAPPVEDAPSRERAKDKKVITWPDEMAEQGFRVDFADPVDVTVKQTTRRVGHRELPVREYRLENEDYTCLAAVYEEVVPAEQDPDSLELIALARDVAEQFRCDVEYELFRRGKGPKVYYIRLSRVSKKSKLDGRIESRRLGDYVLVMATLHDTQVPKASGQSYRFFKSLVVADEE